LEQRQQKQERVRTYRHTLKTLRESSKVVIKQTRSMFDNRQCAVVCEVILKDSHTIRRDEVNIETKVEPVTLPSGQKVTRTVVQSFSGNPFDFIEHVFVHALKEVQKALKWNDGDHVYLYLAPDHENKLSWDLRTPEMPLAELLEGIREQMRNVARVLTSQESFIISKRSIIRINCTQCLMGNLSGHHTKNVKVSCRIVIHEPLDRSLDNGLSNPPYQGFVLTPTSERVTLFLLRCARPFSRHWAERVSLPLKVALAAENATLAALIPDCMTAENMEMLAKLRVSKRKGV